jgi:glyoxylase-like metal-dependent hydrolase (beta-lactamase superfamily II)
MSPVRVRLLVAGHSRQREALAQRGGRWRQIQFPATVAVISHHTGTLLFDTGYAAGYFAATRPFPQRLYRWLVPVELAAGESAREQLAALGVGADQIGSVLISHLHADHIGGLRDFPAARLLVSADADLHGLVPGRPAERSAAWAATSHGYLPSLVPHDFWQRRAPIEDLPAIDTGLPGFDRGYDLFGDASAIAVPLEGHAAGHVGLWLPQTQAEPLFLIGDACWLRTAFTADRQPPAPVRALAFHDGRGYRRTMSALAELAGERPEVVILPSHCAGSLAEAQARFGGHR